MLRPTGKACFLAFVPAAAAKAGRAASKHSMIACRRRYGGMPRSTVAPAVLRAAEGILREFRRFTGAVPAAQKSAGALRVPDALCGRACFPGSRAGTQQAKNIPDRSHTASYGWHQESCDAVCYP